MVYHVEGGLRKTKHWIYSIIFNKEISAKFPMNAEVVSEGAKGGRDSVAWWCELT